MGRVANRDTAERGSIVAIETILVWLIVGAVAGWLAGLIVKGHGFGLVGNIVVGIVGAFLAGWLLPQVGLAIGGGIVAAIINALIGAVILLFIIGLIKRA
ncbi:GlsB/YeaQ/YmgE family stress response membrane protein [Dokdonella koreensis]|uniref:GlsB/YeaQ/YmgE family stress response membrane protein n=1 Tax=Dokdonella koreensis TaxID=323415 RepID=UPI001CBE99A7|nr:GlsB/YeaQ/YmgE family stress response membrane protein [Dokdonella koreensis]